ncbi:uncharacterized protein LOC109805414 isoform X1 [Cajanus cajan]|uniref:uncharacterized protein LOC109805414 isoform X1 n=1 Tax=Cajanus cajan TaxID=3821 RepID=UPI00098DCC73|nr:uncharacterized protein LOC109805414 isoform X1 [Cajanus cajan]
MSNERRIRPRSWTLFDLSGTTLVFTSDAFNNQGHGNQDLSSAHILSSAPASRNNQTSSDAPHSNNNVDTRRRSQLSSHADVPITSTDHVSPRWDHIKNPPPPPAPLLVPRYQPSPLHHPSSSPRPSNYGTNRGTVSTNRDHMKKNQTVSPYRDPIAVSHQFLLRPTATPLSLRENPAVEYSVEEPEDQPLTSTYAYPDDLHARISIMQELVLSIKHEIREERRLRLKAEDEISRDVAMLKRQMQYQD